MEDCKPVYSIFHFDPYARGLRRRLGLAAQLLCLFALGILVCRPAFASAPTGFGRGGSPQAATQTGNALPTGVQTATNPSVPPLPIDAMHAPLGQISSTLDKVQVGHWKVSRDWKRQMHNDIDSIQQDISSQLPALIAKAHASPGQIGPQLAAMQNVSALYDVLVRVSTAASLGGNKGDAGALEDGLQQLESVRKSVSGQLLQAATAQDQRVAQLQAQIPQASGAMEGGRGKTIVVDNDGHRRTRHRKLLHHKGANPATSQSTPKPPKPPNPD